MKQLNMFHGQSYVPSILNDAISLWTKEQTFHTKIEFSFQHFHKLRAKKSPAQLENRPVIKWKCWLFQDGNYKVPLLFQGLLCYLPPWLAFEHRHCILFQWKLTKLRTRTKFCETTNGKRMANKCTPLKLPQRRRVYLIAVRSLGCKPYAFCGT